MAKTLLIGKKLDKWKTCRPAKKLTAKNSIREELAGWRKSCRPAKNLRPAKKLPVGSGWQDLLQTLKVY
jgi:hypothetical protein